MGSRRKSYLNVFGNVVMTYNSRRLIRPTKVIWPTQPVSMIFFLIKMLNILSLFFFTISFK